MRKYKLKSATQQSVEAALRIRTSVKRWTDEDLLFASVRKKFSALAYRDSLLKCVLVNSLYGTNVRSLAPMAEHIVKILSSPNRQRGKELVPAIAKRETSARVDTSFASKFCHLFIDSSIPIYDSVAKETLKSLLGEAFKRDDVRETRYQVFCDNFDRARGSIAANSTIRDFDHFLWISGSYVRWKNDKNVNSELAKLFKTPSAKIRRDLMILDRGLG